MLLTVFLFSSFVRYLSYRSAKKTLWKQDGFVTLIHIILDRVVVLDLADETQKDNSSCKFLAKNTIGTKFICDICKLPLAIIPEQSDENDSDIFT